MYNFSHISLRDSNVSCGHQLFRIYESSSTNLWYTSNSSLFLWLLISYFFRSTYMQFYILIHSFIFVKNLIFRVLPFIYLCNLFTPSVKYSAQNRIFNLLLLRQKAPLIKFRFIYFFLQPNKFSLFHVYLDKITDYSK